MSIGQNIQFTIDAHFCKKSSPFEKELEVKYQTVADDQDSHLRPDWANFRDYSIFINGIGFVIIDKFQNVYEFKFDFSFLYVI